MQSPHKIASMTQRFNTPVLVSSSGVISCRNSRPYILDNMTSFANKMQIFLLQIATVIPIEGTRASVNVPGFQTKSLTITIVCGNESSHAIL